MNARRLAPEVLRALLALAIALSWAALLAMLMGA